MPYGPEGDAKFPNVIADINADRNLSFVVHDGDFKNGSSLCSNEMFFSRVDLFNQFRASADLRPRRQRVDRLPPRQQRRLRSDSSGLHLLRTLFFATDQSLGQRTMTLERRSGEHGLVGLSFRLPGVGVMSPLRWRLHPSGDDLRETVPPEQVQPLATTFERAASGRESR